MRVVAIEISLCICSVCRAVLAGAWRYRYDGHDALFVDSAVARELNRTRQEQLPVDEVDCFRRAAGWSAGRARLARFQFSIKFGRRVKKW